MRGCLVALSLAGCSFPTKPGPPFACVGDQPPSTAPSTIQISGKVSPAPMGNGLPGATVTVFFIGVAAPVQIFSRVTDSAGSFTGSTITGGAPHPAFIQSRLAPDYLDTFVYPALPLAGDTTVDVFQFTQTQIDDLVTAGFLPAMASGTALMFVSIVNCNDDPVAGATLTVKPSSPSSFQVTYVDARGQAPAPNLHVTDETGSAFVTGLSPGKVTLDATLGTTPFQEHTVTVTPGAMTMTEVSP